MNVLIIARLVGQKIIDTIEPIADNSSVKHIYLVRRYPVSIKNTICYAPPKFLRWNIVTAELYRFFVVLYLCATKKINVIVGIHYIPHCIYAGIAGLLFRKPYLMSIIESPDIYRTKGLFRFFIRRAAKIAVRGSKSKEYIAQTFDVNPDQIFILPDFYDVVSRFSQTAEDAKKYDLIFLGHFTPEKRIDVLLNVIQKIKAQMPQIRLGLIGRGELKPEMEQLSEDLHISQNVEFLGFVDDIYSPIQQAKAFIMTSGTEGLPTALIESMSCGLPCIVPDVGDMTDMAKHQVNSLVVEPLNVDQFAQASIQLLTDVELYARLRANVVKTVEDKKQELSLQNVATVWQSALNNL